MTISDILELEGANTSSIYLLKEGIFWRAYNRSAMRMVALLPYKTHKKWIKKVDEYIFYCGFPQQALEKVKEKALEKKYSFNEKEKKVTISGLTDKDDYEKWKEQFKADENILVARESSVKYNAIEKSRVKMLIQKIREYPLENSTPMQAMLFVQQIKKNIKDGDL